MPEPGDVLDQKLHHRPLFLGGRALVRDDVGEDALRAVASDQHTPKYLSLSPHVRDELVLIDTFWELELVALDETLLGDVPVVDPHDGDLVRAPCMSPSLFSKTSSS